MRLSVRFSTSVIAVAAIALCAGIRAQAQVAPAQTTGNGTYIAVDPLAGVHYDNRYEISGNIAYGHIKAGPNLRQGANLGGFDGSGTYWLNSRWGVQGSVRGYYGTSGVVPNTYDIKGPFVSETFFMAGPEYLGPHNKHGAIELYGMVGGVRGSFSSALHDQNHQPVAPGLLGLYNDQTTLGGAFGGHIDLNRSARWVFRITPDCLLTTYGSSVQTQFGLSVGVNYKFAKKR